MIPLLACFPVVSVPVLALSAPMVAPSGPTADTVMLPELFESIFVKMPF
jgi:hypothetical protein